MKNPYEMKFKLNTLIVHANNLFTENEYEYLCALKYLIEQFEGVEKDNRTLCLNLYNGGFLIINHQDSKTINPIVFVDKSGNVLFDVNISVFSVQIKEFQKYVNYIDHKKERADWPHQKKLIAAIKEYKNDSLDFCIHQNLVSDKIIDYARKIYDSDELER